MDSREVGSWIPKNVQAGQMQSRLGFQEQWNHSKDSAGYCFCSYIWISQHLALLWVPHPQHHLHCNSLGSPCLLKESRNEPAPGNQSFANIFTEEKVSFCTGESVTCKDTGSQRTPGGLSSPGWVTWFPHSFLADHLICCSITKSTLSSKYS